MARVRLADHLRDSRRHVTPRSAFRVAALATALASFACGGQTVAPEAEEGVDTDQPYPIHRSAAATDAPSTYKGLPLSLTDNGAPAVTAVSGTIAVICVGMSNAWQECDAYRQRASAEWSDEIDAAVVVVNCASGGHAIESWIDPTYDGVLWDFCKTQLVDRGLQPEQVRVILHKAANAFTTGPGGGVLPAYPDPDSDYLLFRVNLGLFAERVSVEFPSVQAVYTTSRSYGGFSNFAERGEPLSYEEGHALNGWLAENPEVDGVWYGWGPYIWAPGCSTGILSGAGLCYVRGDYEADGVHPSTDGSAKIAGVWHRRLLDEAWYRS